MPGPAGRPTVDDTRPVVPALTYLPNTVPLITLAWSEPGSERAKSPYSATVMLRPVAASIRSMKIFSGGKMVEFIMLRTDEPDESPCESQLNGVIASATLAPA